MWERVALCGFVDKTEDAHAEHKLHGAPHEKELTLSLSLSPQAGNQPFNRAMLFNVGFREAMKDLDWDCLIFHDVDHIPENDRNYYGCGQMPRHFAAKLDKYMYL